MCTIKAILNRGRNKKPAKARYTNIVLIPHGFLAES